MPDICMCQDTTCPRFNECLRAQAKPYKLGQVYYVGSPREPDGSCTHFIKIKTACPKVHDRDKMTDINSP